MNARSIRRARIASCRGCWSFIHAARSCGRSSSESPTHWSCPLTVRIARLSVSSCFFSLSSSRKKRSAVLGTRNAAAAWSSASTSAVPAGSFSMRSTNASAARLSPRPASASMIGALSGRLVRLAEELRERVERGGVLLAGQLERGLLAHLAVAGVERTAQKLLRIGAALVLRREPLDRLQAHRLVNGIERLLRDRHLAPLVAQELRRFDGEVVGAREHDALQHRFALLRAGAVGEQFKPFHAEVGEPGFERFRPERGLVHPQCEEVLERLRAHRLIRVAHRLREHRLRRTAVGRVLRRDGEDARQRRLPHLSDRLSAAARALLANQPDVPAEREFAQLFRRDLRLHRHAGLRRGVAGGLDVAREARRCERPKPRSTAPVPSRRSVRAAARFWPSTAAGRTRAGWPNHQRLRERPSTACPRRGRSPP